MRADARRNRDRIVAAAKAWFATHGPEAPTEDIARSAGVAPGTLYRHFADREALIRAVAINNFDHAIAEATAAVSEEASAWDALVRILRQSQELRLSFRLLTAYPHMHAVLKKERDAEQARKHMVDLLDRVVRRAQAEGTLRTDVGTGDVAVMFALLSHPVTIDPSATAQLASERCMALLLESLRAGEQHDQLPGQAIWPEQITEDRDRR
ncbi:helix-turn-helix domain-containing protein [Pseudonocardia zijingensis]|jgi:AcrR family transcriptional regulator|uniref:TetR/AcrR family transcriptional regulator n=1 Tax=Pseudonocardia zijingensis TaxID=153376 RepID=A0ABP4B932_9PSEU